MNEANEKKPLSPSTNKFKGLDIKSLEESFVNHLEFSLAKDEYSATIRDHYKSLAYTIRDRLIERWVETQQTYYNKTAKRVYYLSLEFLIGRLMCNAITNLGLQDNMEKALEKLGHSLEELRAAEFDAGLGNGGLGRLAACFLDSMATLELPAYGYGIRYEYGIFFQHIKDGYQFETPDNWLRYGNPWEIDRPEYLYPVKFHGKVDHRSNGDGNFKTDWVDTEEIMAMAYDTPIPGFQNNTVNNMRLWAAKSTRDFQLDYFNHGDYERAVAEKVHSETISKVLYPNDNIFEGRELRLKQEYFFVSATIQDIIRRYKKTVSAGFDKFPDLVAIQLNDTHPSIGIPELMRILIDEENVSWDVAWNITVKTFGYTNHTVLPEALEKWPVGLMDYVLPRHLEIIYEINRRFLDEVRDKFPEEPEKIGRMSLIEEGDEKRVRMAFLSIVGSHSVNGVSELHSTILKKDLFRDFFEMWPERFNNKTNGITQRRWLKSCNTRLSELITKNIGDRWITDLYELKNLVPLAEDKNFREEWKGAKRANKERLAEYILNANGVKVDPDSLFDCQVKRIHEYKRQLLNCLHVVSLYNRMKNNPGKKYVPRTIIFAGKAAPGYHTAKLIIKLVNSIAGVVNEDAGLNNRLKMVFLANYGVSLAEIIIPAADLSEQISTAGTEASGTGNMKFALNGALTIGTLDGANVEIREEVGEENFFLFGMTAEEVLTLRQSGYRPRKYYDELPELRDAVDMIASGFFSPGQPDLFRPLTDALLSSDHYMLFADYRSYLECQERVDSTYRDSDLWTKMSIFNAAFMGKFSSDRTIKEYAEEIWNVKPVPIKLPRI